MGGGEAALVDYFITHVFIPRVRLFAKVAQEHLFPPFDDLDARAETIGSEAWERVMSQPASEDSDGSRASPLRRFDTSAKNGLP